MTRIVRSVLAVGVFVVALVSPTAVSSPARAAPSAGSVTKVLVFIEENHSLAQMKAGMPYLYSQAVKYGYATNYRALTHPSLPNYLGIATGDTYGIADDRDPGAHPINPPDVFGATLATRRTAKSYQESMTSSCQLASSGTYAVRHNPWAYVPAERSQCLVDDVPAGTVAAGALRTDIRLGTLPSVAEVTPNLCNDAHNCTLATADTWLKGWLKYLYQAPDWLSGHLAIIVTADEAEPSNPVNSVLTTVISPSQSRHVVSTPLDHYSLNGLLTQVGHAPCMRRGCGAASFADAFGLTIG
jgi:hypothetical protein